MHLRLLPSLAGAPGARLRPTRQPSARSQAMKETPTAKRPKRERDRSYEDPLTQLPVIDGAHDCTKYGCHFHYPDTETLYDGKDMVGFRD